MADNEPLSGDKAKEQDERNTRFAKRIISAICKAMPKVAKGLNLRDSKMTVAHEVDIPGLKELDKFILPSYIIIKGERQRVVYFAVMQAPIYERIKELLDKNDKLRASITEHTSRIQFSCPETNRGFGFVSRSKGFLRGKEYITEAFELTDDHVH